MINPSTKQASPLLVAFAFFNIYVIWGSTYLAVTYGLQGIPPFILVGLRYLVAGIILLSWCKIKGEQLPDFNHIRLQAISGVLMLVGGTGMIAWAEQYISSGQAAILVATEPIMFLLIDRKRWGEYFSNKYILIGLLVGFTGIFLFLKLGVGATNTSSMATIASIIVLVSAMLWVFGSLITKNSKAKSSSVMNASIQLLAGGVASAIIAALKGEYNDFHPADVKWQAWGGLIFLIIMGSLLAYLSFIWLITIKPPAIVSTHTYVNPVVAVFLGWLLMHETVNKGQLLSLVLILAGITLVNLPGYINRKDTVKSD